MKEQPHHLKITLLFLLFHKTLAHVNFSQHKVYLLSREAISYILLKVPSL